MGSALADAWCSARRPSTTAPAAAMYASARRRLPGRRLRRRHLRRRRPDSGLTGIARVKTSTASSRSTAAAARWIAAPAPANVGSTSMTARAACRRSRSRPSPPRAAFARAIHRTVQRHCRVRHCYEQHLITRPDLEGRVSAVHGRDILRMSAAFDPRTDIDPRPRRLRRRGPLAFTPRRRDLDDYPFVFARPDWPRSSVGRGLPRARRVSSVT